ncbi:hypothetical protein C8R47DRAFT_1206161, partial [Mycena vitilis]
WTIIFVSVVLLGNASIWKHSEFHVLKTGYNIAVGSTTIGDAFVQHGGHLPLLTCIYNRRVQQAADVTSKFQFSILIRAVDQTTPYYGALFRLLVLRYLDGVGHPSNLRGGLVSEEDWSKDVNNVVLRATLLLHAVSDNDMRPGGEAWRINWRIIGLDTPTVLGVAPVDTLPRPLHFHTCTYEVDVKINRPLQDLLLASCFRLDDPAYVTPFELWLHGQLLSRDHNTV